MLLAMRKAYRMRLKVERAQKTDAPLRQTGQSRTAKGHSEPLSAFIKY
jgi:hypothetical protein